MWFVFAVLALTLLGVVVLFVAVIAASHTPKLDVRVEGTPSTDRLPQ